MYKYLVSLELKFSDCHAMTNPPPPVTARNEMAKQSITIML